MTDAAGNIKPLNEIVGQLEKSGITAGEAMEVFGQRAGPAMLALVEQGSAALIALTEDMENSGGTAQRIADTQLDTFNGQLKLMTSAIEGLSISIGQNLVPTLVGMVEWMTEAVSAVTDWANENPGLFKTIVLVVATLAAMSLGLGVALVAIGLLIPAILAFGVAAVVATGGIILVIGLLVAAGVALIANWGYIKSQAHRLWQAIGQAVEDAINAMIDVLNFLTLAYRKTFTVIGGIASSVAGALGIGLPDSVKKFVDAIDEGVPHVNVFTEAIEEVGVAERETAVAGDELADSTDDVTEASEGGHSCLGHGEGTTRRGRWRT